MRKVPASARAPRHRRAGRRRTSSSAGNMADELLASPIDHVAVRPLEAAAEPALGRRATQGRFDPFAFSSNGGTPIRALVDLRRCRHSANLQGCSLATFDRSTVARLSSQRDFLSLASSRRRTLAPDAHAHHLIGLSRWPVVGCRGVTAFSFTAIRKPASTRSMRRSPRDSMRTRLPVPQLQCHDPVDSVVQIWSRPYAFWSMKFAPAYRALQFQISCPSRWKVAQPSLMVTCASGNTWLCPFAAAERGLFSLQVAQYSPSSGTSVLETSIS